MTVRICRNNVRFLGENFNEIFLKSNWGLTWWKVELCGSADGMKHLSVFLSLVRAFKKREVYTQLWAGEFCLLQFCLALVRSHLWRKAWGWCALSCNIPELREPSKIYMQRGVSGGLSTSIGSSSSYWVALSPWRHFERQNMGASLQSPPSLAVTRGKDLC